VSDFNKYGIASNGAVSPLRQEVGAIAHIMSLGGGGGAPNIRQIADSLYQTMNTGKGHGGWSINNADGSGGGNGSGKDEKLVFDPDKGIWVPAAEKSKQLASAQSAPILNQVQSQPQQQLAPQQNTYSSWLSKMGQGGPAAPQTTINDYTRYLSPYYRGGI
jgi:hypothetical protein